MDPNLFRLDWDRTMEVIAAVVVLSFLIERALALLFEHRWFLDRFDQKGLKEPIAFAVSAWVCWMWQFDALSVIILRDQNSIVGTLMTGAIIAGGSKASVKLFQDLLGVKSTAQEEKDEQKEAAKRAPAAAPAGPAQ